MDFFGLGSRFTACLISVEAVEFELSSCRPEAQFGLGIDLDLGFDLASVFGAVGLGQAFVNPAASGECGYLEFE